MLLTQATLGDYVFRQVLGTDTEKLSLLFLMELKCIDFQAEIIWNMF